MSLINGMGVRPRLAFGFCMLLAVIMQSNSSAVARAARWSHHRCDAEYAAYLKRHQHAATGTKQAEQERLTHAHGCRLEASLPGPPLVPLTGIGATEGAWRARHRADVEFPGGGAYDPEPGAFPGSVTNDKYNVTFGRGRVDAYTVKFRPGGNQAAASALVKGELPADAKLVVSPKPLGKCAAEELEKPLPRRRGARTLRHCCDLRITLRSVRSAVQRWQCRSGIRFPNARATEPGKPVR